MLNSLPFKEHKVLKKQILNTCRHVLNTYTGLQLKCKIENRQTVTCFHTNIYFKGLYIMW